jgi:hypothetical protein
MSEIRLSVTRADIERAYAETDYGQDPEYDCPVAQALMRLGYAAVEVVTSDQIYIGHERYAAIDERPGGERLWRLIQDFDESDETHVMPAPDEFVLRRIG